MSRPPVTERGWGQRPDIWTALATTRFQRIGHFAHIKHMIKAELQRVIRLTSKR
jgi:hypothetical protein